VAAPTGRFRRADRILRSREFQHVARHGSRAASQSFVVLVARGDGGAEGPRRLGVTVSRRVGNAVVRNRVKRRVREWFRRERVAMPPGLDWVVIARPEAARLPAQETWRELSELARAAAERVR
jgi:ribonuclease P protein component